MNENFSKIKRRYFFGSVAKSAVVGASFALVAIAAVMIGLKLSAGHLAAGFYVLIAFGALILAGGVCFLLIRPSDRSVARSLDSEYDLSERVQTSIEFASEVGTIAAMQRADTSEKLGSLPRKKFSIGKIWQYAVVGVVGVALIVTAIAIPAKKPYVPPKPGDTAFVFSDIQRKVIEELIGEVNSSELSEALKVNAVAPLNALLDENSGLPSVKTVGQMATMIEDTITRLSTVLESDLSYIPLSVQIGSAGYPFLVRTLRRSAAVYADVPLITAENYADFKADKSQLVLNAVTTNLDIYYYELIEGRFGEDSSGSEESPEEPSGANRAAEGESSDSGEVVPLETILSGIASGVKGALAASKVSAEDGLYDAIDKFASALAATSELSGDELATGVSKAFGDAKMSLASAIVPQVDRHAINRYIDVRLWKAFGLEVMPIPPRFSDNYEDDGDDEEQGDNDDEQHEGGYGSGEQHFGSDDLVYDPDTGTYVRYSELLGRYYAIVSEFLGSDNITEEQKALIEKYFDILTNGFGQKN